MKQLENRPDLLFFSSLLEKPQAVRLSGPALWVHEDTDKEFNKEPSCCPSVAAEAEEGHH
jgi:hypothetical protein